MKQIPMVRTWALRLVVVYLAGALAVYGGFRRKKYENPITKDTQQPDKVLFDKAVHDIERGRFEVARITLNTLINTYDTSEFLAKAKLAIADSWYREAGAHGWAQAEAEYKDFILFYPTLEEAAEAQSKVCDIHYKQMDKADRDVTHASRAETECRQLLVQFPNSKFAPIAEQKLRDIQEVLAEGEFRVGEFYHKKGSNPAAANRLAYVVDQYPLYSSADEALWLSADSYRQMPSRFKQKETDALTRIVREYPLSPYSEDAKKRLKELEQPIPEPDPVATAHMKYELENRTKGGMLNPVKNMIRRGPDVHTAAKSGTPAMTSIRPSIPASVPAPVVTTAGTTDVTAGTVSDGSAIDKQPDARQNQPGAAAGERAQQPEPLPTNRAYTAQPKKQKKNKKKDQQKDPVTPATGTATPAAVSSSQK